MQVEKGIQYCEDGETITYWEIGGLSQDGTYYQPEGFDKSQPGESVLVLGIRWEVLFLSNCR